MSFPLPRLVLSRSSLLNDDWYTTPTPETVGANVAVWVSTPGRFQPWGRSGIATKPPWNCRSVAADCVRGSYGVEEATEAEAEGT